MWSILFTMAFIGMIISATTPNNKIWFLIFFVFMMLFVIGQAIAENKQKERIEKLEKKIEELVGDK